MNIQLVESLAQIINALDEEEKTLLNKKITNYEQADLARRQLISTDGTRAKAWGNAKTPYFLTKNSATLSCLRFQRGRKRRGTGQQELDQCSTKEFHP